MCAQTVVIGKRAYTGTLVDHLGNGKAEIEWGGRRLVGQTIESWRREREAGRRPARATGGE